MFFHRSAGACPPRSLACADDGEGNPLACACGMRGPSPYVKGRRFFTVARGPVPRVVHRQDAVLGLLGPKGCFFYRSAGACPPRSLDCADDGEGQALALR